MNGPSRVDYIGAALNLTKHLSFNWLRKCYLLVLCTKDDRSVNRECGVDSITNGLNARQNAE